MDANITIVAGFPHELLGLLRRMKGIGDLSLLQDSDRFARTFETAYPDKSEYIQIISLACKLGIIAEMADIIDEPTWRRRSFINKSIIRLCSENGMKEYLACEILESFMQIFGWEFEVKVARRWEVTERDSIQYHKKNNGRDVSWENTDRGNNINDNKEYVKESSEEVVQEDVENDVNENDVVFNAFDRGIFAKDLPEVSKAFKAESNNADNNPGYQKHKQTAEQSRTNLQSSLKTQSHSKLVNGDEKIYADEDTIYDANEYIKNEILKGGIRFENLMSNAIKRDVAKAIKGNSEAQYRMGKYYAESNTKHTDYEEALKWYRVSASQGNKKAQFELGMLYDGGKVKCKDYKKQAMKCYLGLAESGFPTAQCMLGMKYKFGDGVDEDINEAIKWFKKAAVQGHSDAQRHLGDTYLAIGNKKEAMKWFERAAAAGDVYCEKMLGNR